MAVKCNGKNRSTIWLRMDGSVFGGAFKGFKFPASQQNTPGSPLWNARAQYIETYAKDAYLNDRYKTSRIGMDVDPDKKGFIGREEHTDWAMWVEKDIVDACIRNGGEYVEGWNPFPRADAPTDAYQKGDDAYDLGFKDKPEKKTDSTGYYVMAAIAALGLGYLYFSSED